MTETTIMIDRSNDYTFTREVRDFIEKVDCPTEIKHRFRLVLSTLAAYGHANVRFIPLVDRDRFIDELNESQRRTANA